MEGDSLADVACFVACDGLDGVFGPAVRRNVDGLVDVETQIDAAVIPQREGDNVVAWHLHGPEHSDAGVGKFPRMEEEALVAQEIRTGGRLVWQKISKGQRARRLGRHSLAAYSSNIDTSASWIEYQIFGAPRQCTFTEARSYCPVSLVAGFDLRPPCGKGKLSPQPQSR